MVPLRRSPRKKSALSETHRILMEKSDEETDDEGQLSFFKNARTSTPVRRSPRKQPTNNSRQLQESQSEDALDKDDNLYRKQRKGASIAEPLLTQPVEKGASRAELLLTQPVEKDTTRMTPLTSKTQQNSVQGQLREIIQNQREILAHIGIMKRDLRELAQKKDEAQAPVSVPNRIRIAVKEYFANGEDMDLKWDYQKRFYDEENCELTDYIKKSVKGVAPDVANEVLEAAVKRYFTSKKEAANRKSKNKDALHKQRQATYERKKEKVRRRLQAAEKKNWGMEKKKMVTQLLKSKSAHNLMSSDEEADEGFISHAYSWESDTWRTVKESLDKKYLEVCPSRSRRLLQKRTRGSIKEQQRPDIEEEFSWIFV